MNNKGFSLVTVLILSLAMFLIGSTGLFLATSSYRATRADRNFNMAEKAANAGLLNVFDEINQTGTGGNNRIVSGNVGPAAYDTEVRFGGRNLWFLSSEGRERQTNAVSKVVKTALFQGFFGAGLYTVRGNVDAKLDTSPRLSGCDAVDLSDPTDDCFVPAFVASGTINTLTTQTCTPGNNNSTNGTKAGVYGLPPIVNMDQGDLSRLFFQVGCFNRFGNAGCNQSLLDFFEFDYGFSDATHTQQDMSFQQDGVFANRWGIPVVSIAAPSWTIPTPPALPNICIYNAGGNINLASQMTTCAEIRIDSAAAISGNGSRSGVAVKIYSNTPSAITFNNASNFEFYTANRSSVSNSNNFKIASTYIGSDTASASNAITSCNDFDLNLSGFTRLNTSNRFFRLYTTGVTTLNNTIGVTDPNPSFRIVSTNTINVGANATLTNGTIISGPVQVADTNNVAAPQNLVAAGNITISGVNLFTRSLRFANSSDVYILDSLVYVYAFACPNCSRATSAIFASQTPPDSSLTACRDSTVSGYNGDTRWCGVRTNASSGVFLNIGRDSGGNERPVLFISNNSTFHVDSPRTGVNIWGVWYGEDVTYLSWSRMSVTQDFRGFLVRNFPENLTLNINISGSNFRMNFSRTIINTISDRYRFFRRVSCVREPLTPKAQLIQTRMTNY